MSTFSTRPLGSSSSGAEPDNRPQVQRRRWGRMPSGALVHAYTLANRRGTSVTILTLGAIIQSLCTADRDGAVDDVVLGMDSVDDYLHRSPYFGAVAGRYANRIAHARFTLDGTTYRLAANNGPHHLHGGTVGFDKRLYSARASRSREGVGVVLSLESPDGDEGYPGTVHFSVRYLLDAASRLIVDYRATATRATPFNPSQHSCFNLAGHRAHDVLAHELQLNASHYTPVDPTLIPTGEVAPVDGTPFDFRRPTPIGARIRDPHPQLVHGRGYDHNVVLDSPPHGTPLRHAATLHDPRSGRTLQVHTTEPGLQLYAGTWLDGSIMGKGGRSYPQFAGICLETQHFPNSPNHPHFPSTILRPGRTFRSRTVFAFAAR
jgi:aldose 1-epimerase